MIKEFNRSLVSGETRLGHYPVDVHEEDATIFVDAEVPGFQNEDIKVTIDQSILSIQAKRKTDFIRGVFK